MLKNTWIFPLVRTENNLLRVFHSIVGVWRVRPHIVLHSIHTNTHRISLNSVSSHQEPHSFLKLAPIPIFPKMCPTHNLLCVHVRPLRVDILRIFKGVGKLLVIMEKLLICMCVCWVCVFKGFNSRGKVKIY